MILLRHDIDRLPHQSLKTASIEYSNEIMGTYYFRKNGFIKVSRIIEKINKYGHEIGYHYEDVDLVSRKLKVKSEKDREDLIDRAYESFCRNMEMLRKNFDIKTICMHGSPRSKYDNKLIWTKYNYRDLGIIGEPYFDIDWNEFAYFTDTGRRWNGNNVSVRDKVNSKYNFNYRTTQQIIDNVDKLPSKVMFTIHPERWHDSFLPWAKELVWQNVKNVGKRIIVSRKV